MNLQWGESTVGDDPKVIAVASVSAQLNNIIGVQLRPVSSAIDSKPISVLKTSKMPREK